MTHRVIEVEQTGSGERGEPRELHRCPNRPEAERLAHQEAAKHRGFKPTSNGWEATTADGRTVLISVEMA